MLAGSGNEDVEMLGDPFELSHLGEAGAIRSARGLEIGSASRSFETGGLQSTPIELLVDFMPWR